MDIGHCLIVRKIRICEVQAAADKTLTQRLLYVSSPVQIPVKDFGCLTMQKYIFFTLHNYVSLIDLKKKRRDLVGRTSSFYALNTVYY